MGTWILTYPHTIILTHVNIVWKFLVWLQYMWGLCTYVYVSVEAKGQTQEYIQILWDKLCELTGFVYQLDTSLLHQRGKSLNWGNASMRSSYKVFSQLVINGGRAQQMVGGTVPRLVILCFIRKHTEQARGYQPVSCRWRLHFCFLATQTWIIIQKLF